MCSNSNHDRSIIQTLAILTLAVAVRILATENPVWGDEEITIRFVRALSWWGLLVELPTRQPHLPPYYLLLNIWERTGLPIITARVLSVVAGSSVVVVVWLLGREWWSESVGRDAAVLVALSPVAVLQSGWLRMYAIFTLLACLSWLFLSRRRERAAGGRWWLPSAVVVIWIHPLGMFLTAAQVAYLWTVEHRPWRVTIVAAAAAAPVALLLVAKILGTYGYLPVEAAGTASLVHLKAPPGVPEVIGLPGALLLGRLYTEWQLPALVLTTWVVALGLRRVSSDHGVERLGWWLAGPVVGSLVASYALRPVWQLKYLAVVGPAVALLVAATVRDWPPRRRYVVLGLVVATQVVILFPALTVSPWSALRVWG